MAENPNEKKTRFLEAIKLFVERLAEDRCILAAVLVGSITEETVWRKEGLYLWIIEIDGVTKKLKSDGDDERVFRILVEEDINLCCELIPRSRFKLMVEGSSRTAFSCNFSAKRQLIYCDDPSIEKWFQTANKAATKDKEKELLACACWTTHAIRHANNLLDYKKELTRVRECLTWAAYSLAEIEIIKKGEIYEQYSMARALELQPDLFQEIYLDMISGKPTRKKLTSALRTVERYMDNHWKSLLKPVVQYLKKQRRLVPISEISEFFAYSQVYPWHIESACEWLVRHGEVEKLSAPFKLTKKSRVDVEEPAYSYH